MEVKLNGPNDSNSLSEIKLDGLEDLKWKAHESERSLNIKLYFDRERRKLDSLSNTN